MLLTEHSKNRLRTSLNHWRVCKDFADPMFNYLVYGFEPGSLFKGWYANDATAILHSHPANTVEALKDLTKWMLNCMPPEARGSYEKVGKWIRMDTSDRRKILEEYKLVYSEQDEIMLVLKSEPTQEPVFYN
jgi:hypothetical protein